MSERDFAGLAQAKEEVEEDLRDRTATYQGWWKTAKGRDPAPDEDEWYRIEEAQQIASRGGEIYQAASAGGPYTGSDWPFPDLNGKCFCYALLPYAEKSAHVFRLCWTGKVVTFADPRSPIVLPGVTLPPQPHGYTRMPNSNGNHNEEEINKDLEVTNSVRT